MGRQRTRTAVTFVVPTTAAGPVVASSVVVTMSLGGSLEEQGCVPASVRGLGLACASGVASSAPREAVPSVVSRDSHPARTAEAEVIVGPTPCVAEDAP